MKRGEKKLSLEEYLQFCEDQWRFPLARFQLNEIIFMHGFVRLHHQNKSRIQECLRSIELMPPTRSTLDQIIWPHAFLTAEEVAEDLEALGWQECSVRSIQTLASEAVRDDPLPLMISSSSTSTPVAALRVRRRSFGQGSPAADFVVGGKRPRSKRKSVSINALTAAAVAASSVASSEHVEEDAAPPLPSPPLSDALF